MCSSNAPQALTRNKKATSPKWGMTIPPISDDGRGIFAYTFTIKRLQTFLILLGES